MPMTVGRRGVFRTSKTPVTLSFRPSGRVVAGSLPGGVSRTRR